MPKKMDANEIDVLDVKGVGPITSGMTLEHPMLGLGQVEGIFQFINTGDIIIRIDFDDHGSKALVPEYSILSLPKIDA